MTDKKNLMPLLQHLDQRADNSFTYDKQAEAYVLVQTWHVRVHKHRAPKDEYEIIYVRAGQKFEYEPTEDDIKAFAKQSRAMLNEYCAKGQWQGGAVEGIEDTVVTEPFKFNRWRIKDYREA